MRYLCWLCWHEIKFSTFTSTFVSFCTSFLRPSVGGTLSRIGYTNVEVKVENFIKFSPPICIQVGDGWRKFSPPTPPSQLKDYYTGKVEWVAAAPTLLNLSYTLTRLRRVGAAKNFIPTLYLGMSLRERVGIKFFLPTIYWWGGVPSGDPHPLQGCFWNFVSWEYMINKDSPSRLTEEGGRDEEYSQDTKFQNFKGQPNSIPSIDGS